MSEIEDDQTLLRRYADTGCEQAFAELVARHVHHVYSVARRETPDAHLAEELTQTAFILLARKAKHLPAETILSGWLFQTVRFAAKNARRSANRRLLHEQEIAHMSSLPSESHDAALWNQISPELNDMLASLSQADRDAITLRFFEQKTHQEVANILHTTEVAARKRLSRALDKLRTLLTKRGITVSSATLATLLLSHSVEAAPASLATSVAAAAASGTASIGLPPLVTSTLQAMALAKLKMSLSLGALLLLTLGASVAILAPKNPGSAVSGVLSDGSILRIMDVEFADHVTFRYARPLRFRDRLLLHLLPKSWSSQLVSSRESGSISMSTKNGKDALFLAAARENIPEDSKIHLGRLVVTSDDGSTFDGMFNSGTMGFDRAQMTAWHLDAFPRRGGRLRLGFLYENAQGAWQLATELSITNPVTGPFAEWVPESLPILRTNADLSLRLTSFATNAQGVLNPATSTPKWSAFPTTQWVLDAQRLSGSGMPWAIRSVEISDATGNEWSPMELATWSEPNGPAGARLHAAMIGALWSSEPAWQLRFELSRTNDYAPAELIVWKGFQIPRPEQVIKLSDTRGLGDNALSLKTLSGLNAELPEPFRWLVDKSKMNLAVDLRETADDHRLTLVRISDDQDRTIHFHDPRPPYPQRQFVFSFSPETGARTLNFQFAWHRSRFVEFRAKPANR
ncbi:MAG: sigma-70 family RNA polymerase sigma factor [Verrucomicrobiales bacterium]|nr:sigma-70 family RNA polymerase sigma factor [Verrucomicrobiales bacterium]